MLILIKKIVYNKHPFGFLFEGASIELIIMIKYSVKDKMEKMFVVKGYLKF